MEQFKYYSFDLWETLITRNPAFRSKRDNIFFKTFNPQSKSFEEVSEIVSGCGKEGSLCSELSGTQVTCKHMIFNALVKLGVTDINAQMLSLIEARIQELFIQNPPILYAGTKDTLKALFERDATLSLVSNTGYVLGETITEALSILGIRKYFSYLIYSDELGISKPNPQIFQKLLSLNKPKKPMDVMHVGDNVNADGGCKHLKINYYQINSNKSLITDLI